MKNLTESTNKNQVNNGSVFYNENEYRITN